MSDKPFDFASEQARTSDTATLNVKHPKAGDIGVQIEIAGKDSDLYQEEFKKYRKKLFSQDKDEVGIAATRKLIAEFLAKITISWENVTWEEEPMECSYDNAYKLYSDPAYKWLRDQVDDFASDRGNFLGN